jgi:NADPH-dependent glutamate synthase beta subunit-like oxidoreductase/dihydroorotate dehydrogenase/Pyruvate/2-oxoacid:ferredoxin oxidoreductase delta subunit
VSSTLPPSVHSTSMFLTDAQVRAELGKCEFCERKPCRDACPCHCSPADFIRAITVGETSDWRRAAAQIMSQNPLGGICGMVCPDRFCMAACSHRELDGAVLIPEMQSAIVERAKRLGELRGLAKPTPNGRKVAIIGSGPAGLGAAAVLAQRGYQVTVLERDSAAGGMARCIPGFRLDHSVLESDIRWVLALGETRLELNREVKEPLALLKEGFDAVVVATGLWEPIKLGVAGEELARPGIELLRAPAAHSFKGEVAVVGGGATAFDVAATAQLRGAKRVELFCLEKLSEMPLTRKELDALMSRGIEVSGRVRLSAIQGKPGALTLSTQGVRLRAGETRFHPKHVEDVPGTEGKRPGFEAVLISIGLRSAFPRVDDPRVVYAGDCVEGPTTVVEATAAGKNAAELLDARLSKRAAAAVAKGTHSQVKSQVSIAGHQPLPVPLTTEFFGRPILSPFLLSAAPPSDGYDQMKKAFEAGWAGGIMKTAFDDVPIHIPGEYMFAFDQSTYANCDNVSGHALERVCREVEKLRKEFPDRLVMASTGGPVSGKDEADRKSWQSNTGKLEAAGVMGIEYSLSCPQGGDGTEGDIVSQNAALSAKIVDWVMTAGDANVPKLFKLTGAVTSVAVVVAAIKEVFASHAGKKGGITLANSFPALAFRKGEKGEWEEGVIVGASGAGILPISYLSLAKVAHLGVHVSGNGGPMDYKAAADFLALGARSVQFCTLVTKLGYGIVDDMHSGLSHLLAQRGLKSVAELCGVALPKPIRDFMELTPKKKISSVNPELCLHCGNCTRCPYLALAPDANRVLRTDPARCVGCGICGLKCFASAITMRERTADEAAALKEA